MAVKLTAEVTNLKRLLKKLGPELIKPDIDQAVTESADDAVPVLRTLVGFHSGDLQKSIRSTPISDRASLRSKNPGTPTTGISASYVSGIWYGRFPDRGTRHIRRRGWSVKTRTRIKPNADAHLRQAGQRIQKKWSKP